MLAIEVIASGEEQTNHWLVKTDGLVAMGVKRMGQEHDLGLGAYLPEKRGVLSAHEMEHGMAVAHGALHASILPESPGVAQYLRQRPRGEVLAKQAVIVQRLAVGHGSYSRHIWEEVGKMGYLLSVNPQLVGSESPYRRPHLGIKA